MAPKKKPKLTYYTSHVVPTHTPTHHPYIEYSASTSTGQISVSSSIVTLDKSDNNPCSPNGGNEESADRRLLEGNHEGREMDETDELSLENAYVEYLQGLELENRTVEEVKKRKREKGDESLRTWVPERNKFLEEIIGLDGRGPFASELCVDCSLVGAEYECEDCYGRGMKCGGCMVETHLCNPLHRIKRWNNIFFERCQLRDLGLRIQLGHPIGDRCLRPEQCTNDDFIVIDSHAIHCVGLDFCGCGKSSQSRTTQLLRSRFYPATVTSPKTAITFRALEAFEVLSYESKVSAFEFYQTLARLTDNTGVNRPKDRYPAFLRIIHEWRHLRMLKRAGRGHDPLGVAATKPGELALLCPACPHPGKNMVPGWEKSPPFMRFLYALFIALDANFRLKRKSISSDLIDPGLSSGWAYFVEETTYKAHLEKYKDEIEPKSTCSRHDAVNLSDAKPGRGHAASGIGTVECSRHDLKRPNAVGDLQRGERYCNMDYIFYMSIVNSGLQDFVVSYDIACQWSRNLYDRMFKLDHEFFMFSGEVHVRFLVPKFHLPAHVAPCQTQYSFNYTKGVGRTDGEAPERGWAEVNPLAASTREMGPGSRRDTLDAHFGDYNHRKIIGMGATLRRKMLAAALDMADHVISHRALNGTLSESTRAMWTTQVKAWEDDPTQTNPFDSTVDTPTQASVRRQLATDEAHDLAAGQNFTLDDKVSPSVLLSLGMDLEAEQRSVKSEAGKIWLHAQDRQRTKLQLRCNALQRKIDAWCRFQILYLPAVARLRQTADRQAEENSEPELKPYEFPLWLPSNIKNQLPFDTRFSQIEWDLRIAQAYEALDTLRSNLQMRSHLLKFKDRFSRGQGACTRARSAIDAVKARIDASGVEYRVAYEALISLGAILNKVGWRDKLLPLEDEDIREISMAEDGVSEGNRKLSWIWKTIPVAGVEDDGSLRDTVRIEWCKSRARANRFSEEVALLTEEMGRVIRFLEWQEKDWKRKGNTENWAPMSAMRKEGHRAYAERQAALRRKIRNHFADLWKDLPAYVKRMQDIIEDPSLAEPDEFERGIRAKRSRIA